MNKKNVLIVVLLFCFVFAGMILFNCKKRQNSFEGSIEETTVLKLATCTKNDPGFNNLLQSFMKEYPNIKIVINSYDEEIYNSIIKSSISSGLGPDLFELNGIAVLNSYISTNSVINLKEYISLYNRSKEEINYCCALGGRIYATPPLLKEAFIVLANKEICDVHGISISPKSFEEFYYDCRKLKQKGVIPIAFGSKDLLCVRILAAQALFSLVGGNLSSVPLYQYYDLLEKTILKWKSFFPEYFYNMDYSDAKLMFGKGNAAFFLGAESDYYWHLNWSHNFEAGHFTLYGGEMRRSLYNYSQSYAVNANTLDKIESIEFAKYLTRESTKESYINYNLGVKYLIYSDLQAPGWPNKYVANSIYRYKGSELLDFDWFLDRVQSKLINSY